MVRCHEIIQDYNKLAIHLGNITLLNDCEGFIICRRKPLQVHFSEERVLSFR